MSEINNKYKGNANTAPLYTFIKQLKFVAFLSHIYSKNIYLTFMPVAYLSRLVL